MIRLLSLKAKLRSEIKEYLDAFDSSSSMATDKNEFNECHHGHSSVFDEPGPSATTEDKSPHSSIGRPPIEGAWDSRDRRHPKRWVTSYLSCEDFPICRKGDSQRFLGFTKCDIHELQRRRRRRAIWPQGCTMPNYLADSMMNYRLLHRLSCFPFLTLCDILFSNLKKSATGLEFSRMRRLSSPFRIKPP